MKKNTRKFLIAFSWLLSPVDIIVVLFKAFINLILSSNIIMQSNQVVLCSGAGFGHTITAVDAARRAFPGKTVFIFLSESGRHNWKQALIWQDITVIHLLKSFLVSSPIHSVLIQKVIYWLLTDLFGKRTILFQNQYTSNYSGPFLYDELIKVVKLNTGTIQQPAQTPHDLLWFVYWMHSIRQIDAKPISPPEGVRRSFHQAITSVYGRSSDIITLYLRSKGSDEAGLLRNFGSFDEYRLAIDYLIKKNYIILIVGDVSIKSAPIEIQKYICDAEKAGFNKDWFNILAITECERFIGNPGGGMHLPCLINKPSLIVNVYPYYTGLPYAIILYKRLVTDAEKDLPLQESFDRFLFMNTVPGGYTVRSNTSDEILEATQELISVSLDSWSQYIEPQEVLPSGGWAQEGPSRIARVQCAINS